nr:ornithine carbamoyltransferase [Actinomycetota bacterium]
MKRADLAGKDYISTADWSVEELGISLDAAKELKDAFRSGQPHRLLSDKTLFMIFLDLSTRTRNAFEAGMTQLGGHAHFIDAATSQIAHGESPRDMGMILSSYGHGIAIRHDKVPGEGNAYMRAVAENADAPVINLQCDEDHPTQQLADLMTIEEVFGTRDLSGMKICVSWAFA